MVPDDLVRLDLPTLQVNLGKLGTINYIKGI